MFIEAPYNVETGEAERIAVDWTARGGGGGTSCEFSRPCMSRLFLNAIPRRSGVAFANPTGGCEDVARANPGARQVCHGRDRR